MKKVLLSFLTLFLAGQVAFAQPVSDNAVIPMGISLSSILRLNVVSGGNMEFVFNTFRDYDYGFQGDQYRTQLTVASSTDWSLDVYASSLFEGSAGQIALAAMEYTIQQGTGTNLIGGSAAAAGPGSLYAGADLFVADGSGTFFGLTNASVQVISANTGGNSGDAAANNFYIRWRCGVPDNVLALVPAGVGPNSVTGDIRAHVAASGTSGRSSTNVLISLTAQ